MTVRLGERGVLFVVSALLVLTPFFVVTFPPITDLPQHLAQIRLLGEALADPGGPYRIQWWTPYSLSYALLALCRAIAPPLFAGRLAFALIALLWVATAHVLAVRRGRSPLAAVLASLFVFCHVVYWGFLSFAIGWPVFAAWMHLTSRGVRGPRHVLLLAAMGLVLYAAHALWLLAGVAWIGAVTVADVVRARWKLDALRPLLRPLLWRACALAPAVTALAIWTPDFQASDMRAPPVWSTSPLARLTPDWLVSAALGGLWGPLEWLLMGVVAAWVIAGVAQHRTRLHHAVDGSLLLGAVLLGLFALVLPDSYMSTIKLPQRWMPSAAVLFLLGMPAPRLRPALLGITVVGFAGVCVATTALTWIEFEREELAGLTAALERLPPEPRVLGLDYQQSSARVRGRPFLQTYAWAQVLKGGTLAFSFASFATSPVVFRSRVPPPWTSKLYLYPRRLRSTDLDYFDYVIVNGGPDDHEEVVATLRLAPVTTTGRWRLYRVNRETSDPDRAIAGRPETPDIARRRSDRAALPRASGAGSSAPELLPPRTPALFLQPRAARPRPERGASRSPPGNPSGVGAVEGRGRVGPDTIAIARSVTSSSEARGRAPLFIPAGRRALPHRVHSRRR